MDRWVIYYDNGSTFDQDDGPFESAPIEGVLAVVERRGDRLTIHQGGDYYFRLDDGTIVATDDAATLIRRLGWVKCGRWTSSTKMERLHERIRAEWRE